MKAAGRAFNVFDSLLITGVRLPSVLRCNPRISNLNLDRRSFVMKHPFLLAAVCPCKAGIRTARARCSDFIFVVVARKAYLGLVLATLILHADSP